MPSRILKRKELRDLIGRMKKRDFVIEDKSGNKHLKIVVHCPNGRSFLWVLAATPSDYREWQNAKATLRRELATAGYPDERKFSKISTNDAIRSIADDIHELVDQLLDALDATWIDEPERRRVREIQPYLRDHGRQAAAQHPIAKGRVDESASAIWHNTVRIDTPKGVGSGCVIDYKSTPYWAGRKLLVTNAHVVDGFTEAAYSWISESFTCSATARLIAIDYIHDLAVLELDPQQIPHPDTGGLQVGTSPVPGQTVTMCGFPLGCDTPRLARGIVSGYAAVPIEGVDVTSVVIQAPANQGNSGGPVCGDNGELVGIIWSINPRLRPNIEKPRAPTARQAIDWVERSLIPIDGYGYALDPEDIRSMLHAQAAARKRGQQDESPPKKEIPFPRRAFVELQRQATTVAKRPTDSSCIGVFNYDPDGSIWMGWRYPYRRKAGDRIRLDAPTEWIDLWKKHVKPSSGKHFYLRGYDVVGYDKPMGFPLGYWRPKARLCLE